MGNQELYPCPEYFIALLRDINRVLKLVMYNLNQEEYDSPFENTGNCFKSPVFKVEAYDWDTDSKQDYNFIFYKDKTNNLTIDEDVKVSWYKYLGRDTKINQNLNSETLINIYNQCIDYLNKYGITNLEVDV